MTDTATAVDRSGKPRGRTLIEFRNVSKIYKMGEVEIPALNGVDFAVDEGEFVAVLGASGAGKSTILNILGGMDTATSGEIFVSGSDITKYNSQLSGGEQQRVAIARAVAKNPLLLLCDEPTGALDYKTGKLVLKLLEKVNVEYKKTVVLITHNSALAPMADKVIHVRSGKVEAVEVNASRVPVDEIEW